MPQAEALAEHFAQNKVSLDAIYTSDLLRAKTTAQAVLARQGECNAVPFRELPLLREQNFGAGEGMKFSKMEKNLSIAAHFAKGKFPALYTREAKFPGGESLDELAERAEVVISDIITAEVLKEHESNRQRTVAIFSHGIFIAELVAAILNKDSQNRSGITNRELRGMHNTGCTSLNVTLKVFVFFCMGFSSLKRSPVHKVSHHQAQGQPATTSVKSRNVTFCVQTKGIDRHVHLSNLHRQKGGIGSLAHDPAQQDIRAFLGSQQRSTKPVSGISKGTELPTRFKPY
ncbi:hypothetical protein D9613_006108 [Agrocybe pediades]|uniref:Phosphoglycerate mutase n=1 Tax=Agrocybe pediades TaxID=84607 RepID=A0A8H4QWQ5_9AGAR|nr:hypothetical protein D9613_006108 [Agrocybe pediades]